MEGVIPHVVRPFRASTGLALLLIGSNACASFGGMTFFRLGLLLCNFLCWPARTVERSIIWTIGNYFLFSVSPDLGVLFSISMMLWDAEYYPKIFENGLDCFEYRVYLARTSLRDIHLFGYNSDDDGNVIRWLIQFLSSVLDFLESIRSVIFLHGLQGADFVYLRDLDARGSLINREEELVEPASEVIPRAKRFLEMSATIWCCLTVTGVILVGVAVNLFIVCLVVALIYILNMTPVTAYTPTQEMELKDGIYRITVYFMGVGTSHGIGTCFNGVLHVPYHVIGNTPITGNDGKRYEAVHIDQEADIVTWNGPPQFSVDTDCDKVIIVAQRDNGSTAYVSRTNWYGNDMSFLSVTVPGESGSPVWAWNPELKHEKLVSLAGRYVGTAHGEKTEFNIASQIRVPKPSVTQIEPNETLIAVHPGAGKTRYMIPERVQKIISSGERVIVAGPTRVVCAEILEALKKAGIHGVGSYVGGMTFPNPNAKVVVMAHATLQKFIIGGGISVTKFRHIIIDESHMDDSATVFIKKYCRSGNAHGLKSYLYSATHPGMMADGSNYPIQDIKFEVKDLKRLVNDEIERNNRVVIFAPSITGKQGTDALTQQFKQHKPINLNSKTYLQVARDLMKLERRLIITTNIAECGINLNVDTVIDLGACFRYVWERGAIRGVMMEIDEASKIQRRGRVGRVKNGTYYWCKTPTNGAGYVSSSEIDAHLYARGLDWYNEDDVTPQIPPLSKSQKIACMEDQISPTIGWVVFGTDGKLLMGQSLKEASDTLMQDRGVETGCTQRDFSKRGEEMCPCSDKKVRVWDARDHDLLVAVTSGETLTRKKTNKKKERRLGPQILTRSMVLKEKEIKEETYAKTRKVMRRGSKDPPDEI